MTIQKKQIVKYEELTNNNSYYFLLRPILLEINPSNLSDINKVINKFIYDKGLKGIYIQDHNFETKIKGLVYLVFQDNQDENNIKYNKDYLDAIRKHQLFYKEHYNKKDLVFIIKYPEKWMKDFLKIIEGKYTEVSEYFVNEIYNYNTLLHHIKYKHENLKDHLCKKYNVKPEILSEYWGRFEPKNEVLNFDETKEYLYERCNKTGMA